MKTILYSFAPQDRSGKIRWLLTELELPFDVRTLEGEQNEHKGAEFTALSPMGFVPALQHGDVTLFESGAIAIYLTENLKTNKCLAPRWDSPYRGDFLKWVVFASATLDPLLVKVFRTQNMSDEERKNYLDDIYAQFQKTAVLLEQILEKSPFVVGYEFSAADIMLSQPLDWASSVGFLDKHPTLARYLLQLKARPACLASGVFPEH